MYLDEIEKYFIKKRKKFLILNPRDWVLIEKWYNMGIPIKVVKKGVDQSFETFFSNEENSKSGRTLNTIRYCESVILELWREYKENSIGVNHSEEEDFDDKKYAIEKIAELKNNLINSGEYLKSKNEESIVKLLRNLYKANFNFKYHGYL
ncbi:hypothetical protein HZA55_00700 [Candidatus Poribacteria bacterium]|nr:hypothetical protein [Candidatus Poribacteria bacterium]